MNVSSAPAYDSVSTQMSASQAADQVQTSLLRKALDVQQSTAMQLLQGVPGPLPLASEGSVGTRVNALA